MGNKSMTTEIIEGNKIIAEFIGEKVTHDSSFHYLIGKELFLPKQLKYHSLWDWLIPVVEKIEGEDIFFTIERNQVLISAPYNTNGNTDDDKVGLWCITECIEGKNKIDAVWLAVIEFIKWHKAQNTKKNWNGTVQMDQQQWQQCSRTEKSEWIAKWTNEQP